MISHILSLAALAHLCLADRPIPVAPTTSPTPYPVTTTCTSSSVYTSVYTSFFEYDCSYDIYTDEWVIGPEYFETSY